MPRVPDGVIVSVVDVGVDAPRDLDIERVEVFLPVIMPGGRYEDPRQRPGHADRPCE